MGFGISASVPKVEAPKLPEAPKAPDVKDAAAGAVSGLTGAVGGAAAGLTGKVSGAAEGLAAGAAASAKGAVGGIAGGALGAVGKSATSLSSVAGALAEVAVSFKGAAVDVAMEPHMVLDANAGFGETKFEKGPIWIRVDLAPEQAQENHEILHLRSDDGAFDGKKKISEFTDQTDATVDVVFEDAPMDGTYSLDVIDESGVVHGMFAQIPYGDLRKTKNRF